MWGTAGVSARASEFSGRRPSVRAMAKFVCYGGKGGVGKTTCAAATGLAFAGRGHRTLVVSADPAHSLADAFGVERGRGRRRLREDLWIEAVDPGAGERAYRGIVEALAGELRTAGLRVDDEDIERLFAAGVAPGSDELAALELLADRAGDPEFDRVVVDTAPTGHTLRLLDLPDVLRETVAAAETVRGRVRGVVDTARSAVFGPAAFAMRGDGEDELTALRDRMATVRDLLRDPGRTEFRVVALPEAMAVAETRRLVDRLRDQGIPVDTLVVNRVLAERGADPECARCRARARSHAAQLARVREAFPELGILELPALDPGVTGEAALETLSDHLVGD